MDWFVRVRFTDNTFRLASPEDCSKYDPNNEQTDVRALGEVMQQLIESGAENGRLGLNDPSRWSNDAVDFLSLTLSTSARQLLNVCRRAVVNAKNANSTAFILEKPT